MRGRHEWKSRQYCVALKPMKPSMAFPLNSVLYFLRFYQFKVTLGEDKEAIRAHNLLLVFSKFCYLLAGRIRHKF